MLLLILKLLKSDDVVTTYKFSSPSKIIYEPKIINNYIKYPDLAKNFSISGLSSAIFVIDKKGEIEDIKIEKSLGIAFDRQIIDGLNKLSSEILQGFRFSKNNKYRLMIYFKPNLIQGKVHYSLVALSSTKASN